MTKIQMFFNNHFLVDENDETIAMCTNSATAKILAAALDMYFEKPATEAKYLLCNGCKFIIGGHCTLDVSNHCIRMAEDYFYTPEEKGE